MKVRIFLEGKWVKYSAQEEVQERAILAELTRMGMRNKDQYEADRVDHHLPIGKAELEKEIQGLESWQPEEKKGYYYNEHSRKIEAFKNACLMAKVSGVRDMAVISSILSSNLAWRYARYSSGLEFKEWDTLSLTEKVGRLAARHDFHTLRLLYHVASTKELDAMRLEMYKEPEWWYKGLLHNLSAGAVERLLKEESFLKTICGRQTKKIREAWVQAGLSDPRSWHIANIAKFGQKAIEIKI